MIHEGETRITGDRIVSYEEARDNIERRSRRNLASNSSISEQTQEMDLKAVETKKEIDTIKPTTQPTIQPTIQPQNEQITQFLQQQQQKVTQERAKRNKFDKSIEASQRAQEGKSFFVSEKIPSLYLPFSIPSANYGKFLPAITETSTRTAGFFAYTTKGVWEAAKDISKGKKFDKFTPITKGKNEGKFLKESSYISQDTRNLFEAGSSYIYTGGNKFINSLTFEDIKKNPINVLPAIADVSVKVGVIGQLERGFNIGRQEATPANFKADFIKIDKTAQKVINKLPSIGKSGSLRGGKKPISKAQLRKNSAKTNQQTNAYYKNLQKEMNKQPSFRSKKGFRELQRQLGAKQAGLGKVAKTTGKTPQLPTKKITEIKFPITKQTTVSKASARETKRVQAEARRLYKYYNPPPLTPTPKKIIKVTTKGKPIYSQKLKTIHEITTKPPKVVEKGATQQQTILKVQNKRSATVGELSEKVSYTSKYGKGRQTTGREAILENIKFRLKEQARAREIQKAFSDIVPKNKIDFTPKTIFQPKTQNPYLFFNQERAGLLGFFPLSKNKQNNIFPEIEINRDLSISGDRIELLPKQDSTLQPAVIDVQEEKQIPKIKEDTKRIRKPSQEHKPLFDPIDDPNPPPPSIIPFEKPVPSDPPPKIRIPQHKRTPQKRTPPPFNLPFPTFSKSKRSKGSAYDVLVRRKGIFKKANIKPLTKQSAINFGTYKVGATAAATFKLAPVFGKATTQPLKGNISHFYRKKGLFIEKKEKRIKRYSIGELQEITFKGIRASKNKRKKKKGIFGGVIKWG
ncbi:MAG: hypothetical protein GY853_02165 [PVC group bacterium]|nr:hypothetical protein [PVC group bacterium]